MINWHIFWYLLFFFLLYTAYQRRWLQLPSSDLLAVMLAVVFVFSVFIFSKHFKAALNFITLNRALLYLVPALVFCMVTRVPLLGQFADDTQENKRD